MFDNFGSIMVEHQNESSQKFWFNKLIFMFLIFIFFSKDPFNLVLV